MQTDVQTDDDYVNFLMDTIRKRGYKDILISDCAQAQAFDKIKDILCHLCTDDWKYEPHRRHQNDSKPGYGWVKEVTYTILNSIVSQSHCWLLCIE